MPVLTPRRSVECMLECYEWPVESLTEREMEVLLVVVLDTTKKHVRNVLRKLGAANRTDAVRRAVRRGLVVI